MRDENVPKLIKLENGDIINLNHVVLVSNLQSSYKAFILGLPQPIELTEDDYDVVSQATEYSEAMLYLGINEFSPLTIEKSMKLMTELMMHFVAHSISHQQGTLETFPLQAVFERIANIMNELNTTNPSSKNDVEEDDITDDVEEDI